MTIKDYLKRTASEKWAVGHFNFSEDEALRAIVESAAKLKTPIFIGTSEGERKHVGLKQAVNLVKAFQEEFGIPIFLNADHHKTLESVKKAIDAGYDAILFDGAKLSFEENIKETKKVVEYVKSKFVGQKAEILVEGELGYIGSSSEILKEIPRGAAMKTVDFTTPEEAARFIKETGVDLLAPAVGNIHGMLENAPNPRLDIDRIKQIKKTAGAPLVLHGGSGVADEDFIMQ